jgi:hypothetical protein
MRHDAAWHGFFRSVKGMCERSDDHGMLLDRNGMRALDVAHGSALMQPPLSWRNANCAAPTRLMIRLEHPTGDCNGHRTPQIAHTKTQAILTPNMTIRLQSRRRAVLLVSRMAIRCCCLRVRVYADLTAACSFFNLPKRECCSKGNKVGAPQ